MLFKIHMYVGERETPGLCRGHRRMIQNPWGKVRSVRKWYSVLPDRQKALFSEWRDLLPRTEVIVSQNRESLSVNMQAIVSHNEMMIPGETEDVSPEKGIA